MLRGSRWLLMMLVALAGCPGGGGGIGDSCGGNDDCDGTLQCLNSRCVPRCRRAPECGDGFSCDDRGLCQPASGQAGEPCESEVDCAAGLSCQIDGAETDSNNRLLSHCAAENSTHPAGAACDANQDCRNGTCALGHCVDLCRESRDCAAGTSCVNIPSELAGNALFAGCLPTQGVLTWSIPVASPAAQILLPVPDVARSAELVMSIADLGQKVGASSVLSPAGLRIYNLPCAPSASPCEPDRALDEFFDNEVRHLPDFGQSVLAMPSNPEKPLRAGIYRVEVSSFQADATPGSAIPRVTAVVQLGSNGTLDLHFFFLALDDHPCVAMTDGETLSAGTAQRAAFFQTAYLGELSRMIANAGLSLGELTYETITDHPELDGLDLSAAGALFALGRFPTGINVFFVRSLSPAGVQAFGPNPGPAGLGGTRQSGIVISLDTLCYRDWPAMARLTAHELARYMGLYHNVELETPQHPTWRDPLGDSDDSSNNLMYFSERFDPSTGAGIRLSAGSELSPEQRQILTRSAVLR